MVIRTAAFSLSAPDLASCPRSPLPEIAVIGRSNVGKSSLINLLTQRRDLAKVSVTPGKTQLMNFFVINDRWTLVDLPGYGYAKVAQARRADFNEAVADYLEKRPNLVRVFVLLDSRLPPQPIDLAFVGWLRTCDVPFALVFTKVDKVNATTLAAHQAEFLQTAGLTREEVPDLIACSARTKTGRRELLQAIERALTRGPAS
jgi:GTP-binding protein